MLTADPTGLATDNLYLDTVTITSPDASVENTEKVRVGLWVGSTTPTPTITINTPYAEVAADPIRPYAYVAGTGSAIQIYNVYTGLLVDTIPGVAAQVGAMTISHDGSTLYAVDTSNFKIVPANLDTRAVGAPWSPTSLPLFLDYTRANGTELVLSGNGQIFNAKTGTAFTSRFDGGYYGYVVVAAGPYRVRGEWWLESALARDYWDVHASDGTQSGAPIDSARSRRRITPGQIGAGRLAWRWCSMQRKSCPTGVRPERRSWIPHPQACSERPERHPPRRDSPAAAGHLSQRFETSPSNRPPTRTGPPTTRR